ncbi:MAG: TolC family protein [Campylobacteraceae bacterium]
MKNIIILFIPILLFLTGCSTHTTPLQSNFTMPYSYGDNSSSNKSNVDINWWKNFNSPTLVTLIEDAKKNSPDVLIAIESLEQARLTLENAGLAYYPTISSSASSSGTRTKPDGSSWSTSKSTSGTVSISYELDLWGKIAGQKEEANASYFASKYSKDATMLSLYSSVATAYFNFLATNERLAIAKSNLEISQKLMNVVNGQYKVGTVTALDVYTQQTTLLNQQATVDGLELSLKEYKNALAILIGKTPQEFNTTNDDFWKLNLPTIEAGLPSELLLERPDIAKAREDVNSANAATKVANANRFPSFTLSASGGISSASLLSFKDPTSTLSLGLSAAYTLLDWGNLKNLRDIEVSKTRSAIATYNKTILTALQETSDALNSVAYQKSQVVLQEDIVNFSQKSLEISESQYKHGTSDFTTLLNSQTSYFSARDNLATQRLNHLNALITLYKVLGGGWDMDTEL